MTGRREAVKERSGGRIEFRVDKHGSSLAFIVSKASFTIGS